MYVCKLYFGAHSGDATYSRSLESLIGLGVVFHFALDSGNRLCTMPLTKATILRKFGAPITVIGHGIGGKHIPIMARLAKARRWSKR